MSFNKQFRKHMLFRELLIKLLYLDGLKGINLKDQS